MTGANEQNAASVKQTRPGRLNPAWSWAAFLFTLAALAGLLAYGAAESGYDWEWSRVPALFWNADGPGPLLTGLGVTLQITAWSFVLTAFLGLVTALSRLLGGPVWRGAAKAYLEAIRNTPLMVQLFVIYFVLGPILDIPRFWAAVLALSLFEGAYLSEIIRSGVLAVPDGQWQAAWCLGLSTPETFRRVILPQTGPMLLPPLCSLAISLIKDSALVSTIAIYDLTKEAKLLVSENLLAFEIWLSVAAVYLAINLAVSWLGTILERKAGARAG